MFNVRPTQNAQKQTHSQPQGTNDDVNTCLDWYVEFTMGGTLRANHQEDQDMFRLTTLLNFLMILTAADAALAQTPGVPLASAPRLSGAMGLEPRVAFDNGHPVVAYTDWATQTIWAWDPSSTPVNLNFQAAACDGGHGGLLCLIQSPQPFPLPPIPALKVVEFGAPDQQINTNATGVALDKYAAWRNVATGTIETMEFPFPATVTDSGLQGERPSVFAEFVAYQHNAGRDRRRRLRHFSGPELRS